MARRVVGRCWVMNKGRMLAEYRLNMQLQSQSQLTCEAIRFEPLPGGLVSSHSAEALLLVATDLVGGVFVSAETDAETESSASFNAIAVDAQALATPSTHKARMSRTRRMSFREGIGRRAHHGSDVQPIA